jgi:polyhydroxybutyrate depolymerase
VDAQRTLMVGDMKRTYFLHIPAGFNNQQLVPLVFIFHGFQENSSFARMYSDMDQVANTNRFIVVYPDGSGLSWNASGCCGSALQNNVDEPAFVRAVIADVETTVSVDHKRIYAAGLSNGALLSYRLACTMSDTFAAIAPVAGVLMYSPCQPQQPVSVIHVHGTKDSAVPFEGGGKVPSTDHPFPPVAQSIATWVKLDGCNSEAKMEQNGVLTHSIYSICAPGIAVELYMVNGGNHSWPSKYVAPVSQIIWDFFATHPKP